MVLPEENMQPDGTAAETNQRSSTFRTIVKQLIKLVLTAVVVYFAGKQVVQHWSEVKDYPWDIDPVLIAISFVFHIITFGIFSKTWCLLMPAFGHQVPLRYGFKIAYIANLGRYIPGKIWPIIGQIYLLNKIGIGKKTAFVSWMVAMFYGIPSAFMASVLTIQLYPVMAEESLGTEISVAPTLLLAVALAVAAVSILLPGQVIRFSNFLLKRVKRAPMEFDLTPSIGLQVYLGYFFSWIAYGVSFYTFLHGIMDSPPVPTLAGMGSFVVAYLIGYLAIFAPGGIGARELVLTGVLSPFIGPIAAGVAVAARLWNLLAEALAAIIALVIPMRGNES
ncbi:hypothetical protein GF420_00340 [candidate division GN15 bacterium]|nr:hypothetical protein [candidate division GN15 bacterium]